MTQHEAYAELTSRNGNRYWRFIGWVLEPDRNRAVKETNAFWYFDTPYGREKVRKQGAVTSIYW